MMSLPDLAALVCQTMLWTWGMSLESENDRCVPCSSFTVLLFLYGLCKSALVHTFMTSMLTHTQWATELSVMQEGETGVENEFCQRGKTLGARSEGHCAGSSSPLAALRLNSPHLWGDYWRLSISTNKGGLNYRRHTEKHSSMKDLSPPSVHLTSNWQKEEKKMILKKTRNPRN